jgi:CDP-4-dehydro-6-deoxyglucose reductase, E1
MMRKITVGTVDTTPKTLELITAALASGRISGGVLVNRLEKAFAAYHGIRHCVAVNTGTAADTIAAAVLLERGARLGDEIILPALTFISVANAIIHAGLTPVFADVELDTNNVTAESLERVITNRTRGLLPVHLFGRPAPMDEIMDLAAKHNLSVIEDAAEAHGARYKGRLVGTIGLMGTFSFYVAHIITTGEGGAIITNDDELDSLLRSLRAHGRACSCDVCRLNTGSGDLCEKRFLEDENDAVYDGRFRFERIGYSAKMNDLEAALGIDQVERLDQIVSKRRHNMKELTKGLNAFAEHLLLFDDRNEDELISPLVYPIVIRKGAPFARKQLTRFLEDRGIETRPMFGSIPTQQPAYRHLGFRLGTFPNSEYIGANGFYTGVHQNLEQSDIDWVISAYNDFFKSL